MFNKLWYAEGERDKPEGSRRDERLSHLVNGNNRRCLSDGSKGCKLQERLKI